MKIKYNILWVENDRDWLESIAYEIKEFVEDLGFKFSYDIAIDKSGIGDYNKYDLILMDLNLESEPTGDKIIQEIRNLNIYTDVVLYSASGISAIRTAGHEKELEGVYYSGRNEILFMEKVRGVIMTTIRKTQDLTNLRGLVMAEVSELDVLMGDILSIYLNSAENLKKFHAKVTSAREKTVHKWLEHPNCKKDCFLLIRKATASDVIAKLDASQKALGVHLVLKELTTQGNAIYIAPNGKGFMENYNTDIIRTRNSLAHCKSIAIEKDGTEVLKTLKGDMVFSADTFIKIRKDIVEYHKLFDSIKQVLSTSKPSI